MKNIARLAAALIVASVSAAAMSQSAADPSFAFDAVADPGVYPVLEKYFRASDFVGARMVAADPQLGQIAARPHQVDLAPSLARIGSDIRLGCGSGSPGVIAYNLTSDASPAAEMADPLGSIASATRTIRAGGCDQVGLLPYARFWGAAPAATVTCQYNLASSPYQQVDWSAIDRLYLAGEWLLSDQCVGKTSVADYVKLVSTVAGYVRQRNPNISIFALLSFRYTPPATMVQAIQQMSSLVDGFLLAYPLNPVDEHKYSTAQNLQAVLSAFRSSAP